MSDKIRVYELAKETGLSNKEVLRRLEELNVPAKSHSSSITLGDAQRVKEALGKTQAERAEEERLRREKEKAELERFKNIEAVAAPEQKKAKKVLPPHLRKAQEEKEKAAAAAAQATDAPAAATEAPAAEAPGSPDAPPADEAPVAPAADDGSAAPAAPRMPGAPPKPVEDGEMPKRPAARMPGAPPPPGVTGAGPTPRRKVEPKLPMEGSGRRSIPPPLKKAPARPQGQPGGAPGRPGGAPGRGAPGRPGGAPGRGGPGGGGAPGSPYRQPVGRGGPGGPGGPGGAPGRGGPGGPPAGRGGPGGPGGPGGLGGPGRGPGGPGGRRKKKRKDRSTPEEQAFDMRRRQQALEPSVDQVDVLSGITVGELADKMGVSGAALVKKLFEMGEMATVQQSLPDDTVEIICTELGVEVRFVTVEEVEFGVEEEDAPEDLRPRPPVITVMGHVDHGKTLLLDALRNTDVVSGEAGGITQHIGAYQVRKEGRLITFIDTPGHEAFTAMRARGAQVTDIAVLVVAANDGVMPQTVEAINHAKAAEVPIVVAINKMDLDSAQPDRVKGQLTEHELVAEDFGGDVPMVPVSAKSGQGLDDLLEILLLQADLLELQANPDKDARGRVVEAHLDRGRGAVATVLVQNGTLNKGDILVAGQADGKVRAMFDERGNDLASAPPGTPVQILGMNEVPEAGDEFRVVDAERFARDVAERRAERARRAELAEQSRPKTLEDLAAEVERGDVATLNLIIKADVSGSAEALEDSLSKLELEKVAVKVVMKGVGGITESDVRLAEASDAIIVGFNVRPGANARQAIDESGVDVRLYSIIYEAIEDIERAVKGLLAPEFEEIVVGEAEVREVFKVPKIGFVFGCFVTEGDIKRNAQVRVIRDGVVVATDKIDSLRRFKDDVTEVTKGFECGIGLDKFQDIKAGDVFEVFEKREIERV